MAYMIPLQNGRKVGNLTGFSRLKHISSLPAFLRGPTGTARPWTVEVVTLSCVLIILGLLCFMWTAIKPDYGSFILGGVLVTLGACCLVAVCAVYYYLEQRRPAAIVDAEASEEAQQGPQTPTDGAKDMDAAETTMMVPKGSHTSLNSNSAVSLSSDPRSGDPQPNNV